MLPDLTAIRHAQLFELLRQQNLSDHISARLRARSFARNQLDQDEAAMIRSVAMNSWGPMATSPSL